MLPVVPAQTSSYALRVEPLVDSWDRQIASVRVSVTDKCNFRCRYCMPAEGLEWLGREELLTFEEMTRLVGVLARMGVSEVRLTGGEPLARRDLPALVSMLAQIPGVDDLSLTTNGVLLDRFCGPRPVNYEHGESLWGVPWASLRQTCYPDRAGPTT